MVTLAFALYTDHRLEDWYITFRTSKNLAEGKGLTFTEGERMYSFTSPINTLLHAFLAFVFKNNPEEWAIWGYRCINSIVMGFCSILLFKLGEHFLLKTPIKHMLVGLFLFHPLILDNSINGMEVPYMMAFLLLLVHALFYEERKPILYLTVSFAGLMYTRPDGFVYALTILLGYLVFQGPFKDWRARLPVLSQVAKAAGWALLCYSPWLVFTWVYYGSPIPHTILAKSELVDYGYWNLLKSLIRFPLALLDRSSCTSIVFMPAYAGFGGWYYLHLGSRVVSTIAIFAFLFPFIPRFARALSFSMYVIAFYLTHLSGQGPMPWYLPSLAIQAILVMVLLLNFMATVWERERLADAVCLLFLTYCAVLTLFSAYEFKLQQQLIEDGNRKKIGLWLKAHTGTSKSTVFLECLGYIGYYSGLKMYDYPGLSSPEVVQTVKDLKAEKKGVTFTNIIHRLHPDWLVLRSREATKAYEEETELMSETYRLVKIFDVRRQLPRSWYLMGRPYLSADATFYIYERRGRH